MKKSFRLSLALTALLISFILPIAQSSADEVGNCVKAQVRTIPQVTVFFGNDSASLSDKAKSKLDDLISNLRDLNVVRIKITGFVSAVGPKVRHSTLSTDRAQNVEAYLAENGIQVEFESSGKGITKNKSKSANARKAVITAFVEEKVANGGVVPQISILNTGAIKFEQNKSIDLELVKLDDKSKLDNANPTSFTISPALPEGLVFDTRTGKVTGTTTQPSAEITYTITASNSCGSKAVKVEIQSISAPQQETLPSISAPSTGSGAGECNNDQGDQNKDNCKGGTDDRGKG